MSARRNRAGAPLRDDDAVPPALEIDRLSSGYGTTKVIRDVSLSVPAGSVTTVLGPNGAGKTTILLTISGFLPAMSGTIRINGTDVTRSKAHRRAAAGLCHVPERRGIFRGLSVRENLVMQARKGESTQAVDQAASLFPILGHRLSQQAGTLSGGQQQMLALAAAYVRRPSLVLVDEASLGLAPLVVEEIFTSLQRLSKAGTALLIVDQFATRALQMASTAYVLRRGSVVYSGTSADLLKAGVFERYLGVEERVDGELA